MTVRRRQRGIALLLVLWVFMLLGVLALDFARYIRDDAMAAVNFADETRGYYEAVAGMNLALWESKDRAKIAQLQQQRQQQQQNQNQNPNQLHQLPTTLDDEPERRVPPDGQWHEGEFGGGKWSVRMQDEGGRIPLNGLKPESPEHQIFLKYVIENLMRGGNKTKGIDVHGEKAIDTVVDSILDWRDRDEKSTRPNGAEADWYRKQGLPYRPRNGPFESPEELLRVRGVTPALFYGSEGMPGLRDVFSVRLGRYQSENSRKVNIRSATPAVLQALIGDADMVEALIAQRDGEEGSGSGAPILDLVLGLLTTNSGGLKADDFVADYEPEVLMVEAHGDVSTERNQSRIAALVDLSGDDVTILQWFDRAPWDGKLPGLPDAPEAQG
jgi:general secretion pathway protein K